jgi:enoyl-[acyl-carrier protein] reductase II
VKEFILIKNEFYKKIETAYDSNAGTDLLKEVLGRGRAKKGMFEGDLVEGELEIGQVASLISNVMHAKDVVREIIDEYRAALEEQKTAKFQF